MTKTPLFTGAGVAIVTPFKDGKVNFKKFDELIDFQIENGTSAIIVCGTTGESATQTLEEHVEVVDHCIKYVNGRIKVIAGTGSNDTAAALYLSQEAERSGADGLLLVTPYYNKATQLGLVKHFTYVADRVNIPIILYNVPSRTGCNIGLNTYKELAKHPLINGVKEASGDISAIAKIMAACGDDLFVWSGNDDQTVPIMSLGALGVISVVSNILPRLMADICDLCLKGDYKAAAKLHLDNLDIMNDLFIETNPIPVKVAMNLMGMDAGELRLPLCEMLPENEAKLKASMIKSGINL